MMFSKKTSSLTLIALGLTTSFLLTFAMTLDTHTNVDAGSSHDAQKAPFWSVITASATPYDSANSSRVEDGSYNQTTISVNGYTLMADLAVTPKQQELGLSVKSNLSENSAMLF